MYPGSDQVGAWDGVCVLGGGGGVNEGEHNISLADNHSYIRRS